jgi:hypothetical protein
MYKNSKQKDKVNYPNMNVMKVLFVVPIPKGTGLYATSLERDSTFEHFMAFAALKSRKGIS